MPHLSDIYGPISSAKQPDPVELSNQENEEFNRDFWLKSKATRELVNGLISKSASANLRAELLAKEGKSAAAATWLVEARALAKVVNLIENNRYE